MTFKELTAHFGTASDMARAIGVTRQCVGNWKARGGIRSIPARQAQRIAEVSGGAFAWNEQTGRLERV